MNRRSKSWALEENKDTRTEVKRRVKKVKQLKPKIESNTKEMG